MKINWDVQEAGVDVMARTGTPLPEACSESVRRTKCALKAPITTPVGTGFRSINVHLRQALGLFACIRPCKHYKGVRTYFSELPVDLVIVRENTEDLYAGVEFEAGKPETAELIEFINANQQERQDQDRAPTRPASASSRSASRGTERIVQLRVRLRPRERPQEGHGRPQGEHHEVLRRPVPGDGARTSPRSIPDIEFEDRIVDNMCMQLVQKPELYDVLVLPNLYGDILSDLGAGLVGGLGVAPGANIGPDGAVFEATHGSAPKYKGQNKVNPTALILSGMLMLEHLGETDAAAAARRRPSADVIAEGKNVTYDLKADRNDPTAVGTREMADAICEKLK